MIWNQVAAIEIRAFNPLQAVPVFQTLYNLTAEDNPQCLQMWPDHDQLFKNLMVDSIWKNTANYLKFRLYIVILCAILGEMSIFTIKSPQ